MTSLDIRPVAAADRDAWRGLWQEYRRALDGGVADAVTDDVWRRIMDPREVVWSLLARGTDGAACGFANYVLHPHTWSLGQVCHLEDLFTAEGARGAGVGRALIGSLVALGKQQGWCRVYWHTRERNLRARALYDRVASRTDFVRYDIDL